MFKNYLKLTFRSLWKSKMFVLINIVGMGTAIGCCIVAYLNYEFNSGFDADQKDTGNVYRVDTKRIYQNQVQLNGISPFPLGAAIDENIGQVQSILRFLPFGAKFKIEDEVFYENISFVDATFFDFFNFEVLSGNLKTLENKSSIFISNELADKYFPDDDPIGKTLTQFYEGTPIDYLVSGVFKKKPLNSSFGGISTIANIHNYFDFFSDDNEHDIENDWSQWITLFVKIDGVNSIGSIEDRLTTSYVEIQNKARLDFKVEEYELEPFQGMAQRAEKDEVNNHWLWESTPLAAVIAPGIMAILILLIACFNFTNTSMAIASKRLKEIGLRKVMGGLRQQLILQFLLENMLLCFFALVVGLMVAAFLVPAYSALWPFLELSFDFNKNFQFYIFLILVLIFTGLLAGSYPAFYISRFEPATILKGSLKYGGTNRITSILLTLQFSLSMIAVILGVVFYQNALYQEQIDYGYHTSGSISLYFDNIDDFRLYENEISNNPNVQAIAGSAHHIARSYRNDPVKNGATEYDTDILDIGNNFFETVGFTLLDGRKFRKNSETDMQESVIVSEELVRVFGWDRPLGKKLVWMDSVPLYVIGVMKDVHLSGVWGPIRPLMLRYVPEEDYHFMTVQFPVEQHQSINEYLSKVWKSQFPDDMYTGQFIDGDLAESTRTNKSIIRIFGFLGVVATFLSIIGLFSLVSLSILKRMKEIGVRKVLGASVPHIVGLLNRNYLIVLAIACLIGSMCSYFMANMLMDMIWTYHISPNAVSFIASIAGIFIIAFCTVGLKVYRAAMANPTDTIRTE